MSLGRRHILKLLESAGIVENGPDVCDIQVRDPRLYRRVLLQGSLGLGEAYMDGWWDCLALEEFFFRVILARLDTQVHSFSNATNAMMARLRNMQSRMRSGIVARQHYDIGNDLYKTMLDKRMMYSCGYWREADDLDAAQEAKLELIACKLELRPGDRVLDIGCGWGGACEFFAKEYGAHVVGVTVSQGQYELAQQRCEGLPVTILKTDYRDLADDAEFEAVYSIGMFEHVGYKNYDTYMSKVHSMLPEGGRFLLHTIGNSTTLTHSDPWINRYIFPNGMTPSPTQISESIEPYFVMEDWHNFGLDYERTLMEWRGNFELAWEEDLQDNYDDRFFRMWRYYLSCSAASFRARQSQLWQILLVRDGLNEMVPACR